MSTTVTITAVEDALRLLHEAGEVFEVRILGTARGTVSGYFDDVTAAAREIAKWDGKASAIYVSMNPVKPDLMARAANRLKDHARETSSDSDVTCRRWLLIDVDAARPSGISATDEEAQAACETARRIKAFLEDECHWPKGMVVNSGNGAHLLYRVDLPNDPESRDLVKRVLAALATKFDADGVHVDTSVHNAARIVKVPGTMACKGDNIPERPHRRSNVVSTPAEWTPVTRVHLHALVRTPKTDPPRTNTGASGNGKFDLEEFLASNQLQVRNHKQEAGADVWVLNVCPFNADHDRGEAFVRRDVSGALSAGCQHQSCTWQWPDLRERYEPGYKEKRESQQAPRQTTAEPEPGSATSDWPFIEWSDFWDRDPCDAEWVWEDVLARGRGHALYSLHKEGKSLLMLYMAAALATSSGPYVAVYLDWEQTPDDLYERLENMGYGPESDLARLCYYLLPSIPPLDTAAGAEHLTRLLDSVQAKWPEHHLVVLIDTIARAVEGSENDADTYRGFYNNTGITLKRRGATWARLDHAGKDSSQGQRGSSGKGDDVDVVWRLSKTQNGVRLDRDLARMYWVPERVVFRLVEEPTLHYVRATDDYPAGTGELANILDRLNVPLDASSRKAGEALKSINEGRRNDKVCAALRWRRERRENPL